MRRLGLNASLAVGLLALAAWVVFGLLLPVGAGAIHVLLPVGMMLVIRRVVTGPDAW